MCGISGFLDRSHSLGTHELEAIVLKMVNTPPGSRWGIGAWRSSISHRKATSLCGPRADGM
jgi:hypothetical protein